MEKLLLLKRNFRKGISQSLTFFLIILITSLLVNSSLVIKNNYNQNHDQLARDLNSPHTSLLMYGENDKPLKEFVKEDSRVKEYESTPILAKFGNYSLDGEKSDAYAVFLDRSIERKLGKSRVVQEMTEQQKSKIDTTKPAIYVTSLLNSAHNYKLGDLFIFKTTDKDYEFTIAGFVENMYLGMTNTMVISFEMDHNQFVRMSSVLGDESKGLWSKTLLHDEKDLEKFSRESFESFKEDTQPIFSVLDWTMVRDFRISSPSIISTILFAFALIILLVALIVVRFRIKNSIEDDLRNIGALKAIGYTGKDLLQVYLIQFGTITSLAIILGIIASYVTMPLLSSMLEAQSGIQWTARIDLKSSLLTGLVLLGTVFIVTWFSSQGATKVEPITALRAGSQSHSFKRNFFPLEKHQRFLNLTLSLKQLFGRYKQSIMILLISAAVGFASMFAIIMFYNVNVDDARFRAVVGGEIPDVYVVLNENVSIEKYQNELSAIAEIERATPFDTLKVDILDVSAIMDMTPDYKMINNEGLYEGRSPIHDNEVALCPQLLEGTDKKIGDFVTLTYGSKSEDYLITGFVQSANNFGRDLQLTTKGAQRLEPTLKNTKFHLYTKEGINVNNLVKDLEKKYLNEFQSIVNVQEVANQNVSTFLKMVSIVVIFILLVTLGIIALVLYLTIKTTILQNRKDLGIQKAIGFTNAQLMMQMSLSNLPVILIGALIGATFGGLMMNTLLASLLKEVGVMKVDFFIFPWMILLFTIVFSILSFIISMVIARPIKKITPYELFLEN